jgi:hypothetical protein
MKIAARRSLARCTRASKPAHKQIRLIVLLSTVAVASGLTMASASSGSFRGLLFRGLGLGGGGLVDASIPPVASTSLTPIGLAAPVSDVQLNRARRGHTATLLTDGKVLIVGGENSDGLVTPAEIFDPATETFAVSGNLNTRRADHTATRLSDGRVLVAGGRGDLGSLNSTEIFDPTSGAFTSGPNLNSARSGQSATTLGDGRVVFGGGDPAGTVEIYDPQANTCTGVGANLTAPRTMHSAALLNDGNILIVGGSAADGSDVLTAEILNVSTPSVSAVGNQTADGHVRATLRVLPDGKVQIIGSSDHEDMEIYDPAVNSFGAHAHVFPIGDSHPALLQEIMDAPMRAAMFRLGASSALLNRTGQRVTELPGSNQALVTGGVDSSGAFLNSASTLNSSTATVTTDKLDYAPGTPVLVSGTGWKPNEFVTIMFHEDPHVGTENPHTFTVQADANGNFVNQQYAPEDADVGVTYILAATGGSSGWTAQTAFMDVATNRNWVGCTDTEWGTASNWSTGTTCPGAGGAPVSGDYVIVPAAPAGGVFPTISASTSSATLDINNITIDSGATVTMTGGTLMVSHDWKNSGTFTATTGGLVRFTGNNGGAAWPSGSATDQFFDLTIDTGVTEAIDKAGTIKIAHNWTNNGTAPITNATFEFNGTGAQTIGGSATTTFNNLTISNTGNAISISPTTNLMNVTGTLNMNAAATVLIPAAAVVINSGGAAGTITGSGTIKVTRTAATADYVNQYKFSTNTLSSMTVDYAGTGAETINSTVGSYGALKTSGSGTKTAAGALTINGDITIGSGTTFAAGMSLTHNVGGNWTNNGTFSFTTASTINFNTAGSKTISGSSTTAFQNIIVNKGTDTTNVLEANGVGAISNTGNITITNGLFKMTTGTFQFNAGPTIPWTGGIHVDGATLNSGGFSYANNGLIRVTAGTAAFGTASGNAVTNASGSTFDVQGGTVNFSGRLQGTGGSVSISGGTIKVCSVGNASGTLGSFDMSATTSLTMSGGTVVFQNANSSGTPKDFVITSGAGTKSITGGTFQFGNGSTPASQSFRINSAIAIQDLTVNSTNAPSATLDASLTVNGTLTLSGGNITTGANTLVIGTSGSISRLSGHVVGKLQKNLNTGSGQSFTFHIGDAANYTPATLSNLNVTVAGNIAATTTSNDTIVTGNPGSGIDSAKDVNRSWNLTRGGGLTLSAYDAAFTYAAGDKDGGTTESNFVLRKLASVTWTSPSTTSVDTTNHTITGTGFTDMSDFAVGEPVTPDLTVAVSPSSVTEDGATNLGYTFTRSGVAGGALTVNFTVGGTATFGTDYTQTGAATFTASSGTVTFGAGSSTAMVTVDPTTDTTYENDETVVLTVPSGSGYNVGTPSAATGTITNDDTAPSFSIDDVSMAEGNSSTTAFVFHVTKTDSTAITATVHFSTADDTAMVSDGDYQANSGTLTFAPGDTDKTITVLVNGDTHVEPNEDFFVNLDSPTAATINDGQGQGNIQNDDTSDTYTWVGPVVNTLWTNPLNWSPTRLIPNVADTLIFDGGVTSSPTVTGIPSQTIKGLHFQNGVNATFNSDTVVPGTKTLTISGVGGDLLVQGGGSPSTLTVAGTTALNTSATSSATGSVGGQIIFQDGAHRLIGTAASAITFQNGSIFTTSTCFTGNAFGDGSSAANGAAGSILFASGSSYFHNAGSSPFGNSVNPAVTVFQTGSLATFLTTDGFEANNRTYADLAIGQLNPGGVAVAASDSGTGHFQFDNLTINAAGTTNSSLTFTGTGSSTVTIQGSITSNGVGTGTLPDVTLTAPGGITINKSGPAAVFGNDGSNSRSVNLDGNVTVTNGTTLTLSRIVQLGFGNPNGKTLTVNLTGALNGGATGYVIGSVSKVFDTGSGQSFTYHIGDAAGHYTPAALANLNVTGGGNITANTTGNDGVLSNAGSGIFSGKDVNRSWNLTRGDGLTISLYDAAFTYAASDIDGGANEAGFILRKLTSGTWTSPPGGSSVNTGTHTITGTGFTDLSDFAVGESVGSLQFSAAKYDDTETDSGMHTAIITVQRTGGLGGAVSAHYATSNGTALEPGDYEATSSDLNWADGDSADKTFTVTVHGDTKDEPNETVNLTLSAPTGGASLGSPSTATLTILDDDPMPTITISDVTQNEGDAGPTLFNFIVTLSNPSQGTITVDYATQNNTAIEPSDFTSKTGTVTFSPGDTEETVTVTVNGDTTLEANETFFVNLSNNSSNSILAFGTKGTGTITNDDTAPSFSITASVSHSEGDSGTTAFDFTVTKSGTTALDAKVDYATADGSATAPSDYTAHPSTTLTFAPGETTKTVTVLVNGDTIFEANETLTVTLSKPVDASITAGSETGAGTITNDDTAPTTTTVQDKTAPYSDNDQSVTLTATVTGSVVNGGTVTFTVKDGATTIGSPVVSGTVSGGNASANYTLPGGTAPDDYTIGAVYSGTFGFAGSNGTGTLKVTPADLQSDTATLDADFKKIDGFDVLFNKIDRSTLLKLENTNPGTFHYRLRMTNLTGADLNSNNGTTLRPFIEVPAMVDCGGVPCPSTVSTTLPAFSLKNKHAVHVHPDGHTDEMKAVYAYKSTGNCSDPAGYSTTFPADESPRCIMVSGFALPKKHRAEIDMTFEFRWKKTMNWSADSSLWFFSGFPFKATVQAIFTSPAVTKTGYFTVGLVGAGQRVTAVGGFAFNGLAHPTTGLIVRLFDSTKPVAACSSSTNLVAQDTINADGFYFIWRKGTIQDTAGVNDLPDGVKYVVQICNGGTEVARRTMRDKLGKREFDEEDFYGVMGP